MKVTLFDFQETALEALQMKLVDARRLASITNPQAVSFSAPTGAGKTIVMTALFEDIFFGEPAFDGQSDAVVLWISDMPELNEQTRLKIEGKSDRIRTRQLVTIDASFDAERLQGGHVYFMNTQKLGTEKVLTRHGDGRQHTIWETLTNTAKAIPDRFYVVIDEAHRGMRSARKDQAAKTIMQKFLLGSPSDGLAKMPLVVGVSATPQRFDELLSGTTHTVHKVLIQGADVCESGLLKDRILIHYPDYPSQAEMSLLAEAANRWQGMSMRWEGYCKQEGLDRVSPIFVIQVEDGTESVLTKTNLGTGLTVVEKAIGRQLRDNEVAHTFNESPDLDIDGRRVRRVEASRIEEDRNIGVVLFKMSLSTGWDCPQAEVMMSFRRAQDHTYIAQLLGRMVRTPLARRVSSDADLNHVHLYLPHYDEKTVKQVIEDLKNVEDVPPSETGSSRELVTLYRREGLDDLFEATSKLITYRVGATRNQSALRRLMGMARGLTHDEIDEDAQERITGQIIKRLDQEVQRLRKNGQLEERSKQILGIELNTISIDHSTGTAEDGGEYTIGAASADVQREFDQVGRALGNGLHMDYWKTHAERDADEVKVEAIVVGQDHDAIERLEHFAAEEVDRLYDKHSRDFATLKDARRQHYNGLRLATAEPKTIIWELPASIDFSRSAEAVEYEKHLYLEENGVFIADLGSWERDILAEELADDSVVGWLRNVDRKGWSLEIPYNDSGTIKPMFPDLLIVRHDKKGFAFDVLEPHNPSLKDNHAKAIGLAEFAEKHSNLFSRIELIRKKRDASGTERYFRLDLGKSAIRKLVVKANDNSRLDEIIDSHAKVRT